ncbi:MAG: hypothetical protein ACI8U4_001314 [Natronomonas sp.]|jgi:hypothetical protein
MKRTIAILFAVLVVASVLAAPVAAQPGDNVDECENADEGPSGDAGPPGFVSGLLDGVAGFLGDLFSSLPVPNFVKGFFGASTC